MSTNPQQTQSQRTAAGRAQRTVGVNNLDDGDAVGTKQFFANSARERKRIRANETSLEDDEWEQMDAAVMEEALRPLTLVEAIENGPAGLTRDVGMAQTEFTWKVRSGEFTEAERTMDPASTAEEDAPEYGKDGVPVPIIHKDYRIGERELRVSRNEGRALDTVMAQDAGRVVGELLEQQVLNGWSATFNSGLEMYGLRNHPDRNTYTGGDWSTGETVKTDVLNMINMLEDDNFFEGSTGYWLILPDQQYRHLREDYKPDVDVSVTTEEKITTELTEVRNVIRSQYLPDGEAIMFKPISRVFELGRDPQGVQNLQWTQAGGMVNKFKVIALQAPAVKSTHAGRSGVVHASGLS